MAKVKKPMLPPSNFNPSVFEHKEATLPTAETVTSAAAILTGQEPPLKTPHKAKTAQEPKKKKIEIEDKSNRVGITALVERTLLKKVKIYALEKGISMSDVCNFALHEYLKNNK
jgi:hypothetical protein